MEYNQTSTPNKINSKSVFIAHRGQEFRHLFWQYIITKSKDRFKVSTNIHSKLYFNFLSAMSTATG